MRSSIVVVLIGISIALLRSIITALWSTASEDETPRVDVFLPITQRSLEDPWPGSSFCKTLLSALVNGYDPILYNWDVNLAGRDTHKLKVFGKHASLTRMLNKTGLSKLLRTSLHDIVQTDIVVMADALDVWFQLPPRDLVRRYQEYGKHVVAGAELRCWPNGKDTLVNGA
jgi:hypothetical protein